jgi:Domain of unknown function (DUF4249)
MHSNYTKYQSIQKTICLLGVFIVATLLHSCNIKKEIELNLPSYGQAYVVECYLMPDQPYQLLLSQSEAIESSIPLNPIIDADVFIYHNGDTIRLEAFPVYDSLKLKVYNYSSSKIVAYDTIHPFSLEIRIKNSNVVLRSQTIFLKKPKLDSIQVKTSDSVNYAINATFNDIDLLNDNYYYFQIYDYKDARDLNSSPKNSGLFTDKLISNGKIGLFTSYKYTNAEKIAVRAFNLDKDHYTFMSTFGGAQNALGNPFGKPTFIQGNVSNAIGIFTAMSYDEKLLTIGKDTLQNQ